MRVLSLCAAAIVGSAVLALAVASCGDKVQSGLTGIDIKVSFESDLPIKHLRFAGFLDQNPAFPIDDRPNLGENRELDPGDENLIVLLPDMMGEKTLFVRVDGLDDFGSIVASAGGSQIVERDKILTMVVHLGEPRVCGDGAKHQTAEQCDDGNQLGNDGCSGECVVEAGWTCEGAPSVCRTCGDGICSVGEDHCSCREDCEGIATCGDGLCCPGRDENVCSCPEDCAEEGAATCPDTFCCPDERAEGNCEPDCGNCGDNNCEPEKGEDSCTCSQDCPDEPPVCGNQICCGGETMENCALDCCPESPVDGDGTCCPSESADSSPEDCCDTMAQCGDSSCCPGENPQDCPECCTNPICGDDICCGDETVSSCPQDCCPACGDFQECTGCCAGDCPEDNSQCDLVCDSGCSCYFECQTSNGCNVTCTNSSCYVECTQTDKECNVTCSNGPTTGDGGVGTGAVPGISGCYCRGSRCNLTCPPGTPIIDCGDGGQACGPASCP
jgi:hypothetical protein